MNSIVYLLIGILTGGVTGYFIGKQNKMETFVNDAEKLKSENMVKLKDYFTKETDGEIGNGMFVNC